MINLYIYSDESGVFDKDHQKYFVFAGYIFLSKKDKEDACRKYCCVEKEIRKIGGEKYKDKELKASIIENDHKRKLTNILKSYQKFSTVILLEKVYDEIFKNKKSKQRFMDFAYKLVIKRKIEKLIEDKLINAKEVNAINIYVDQHTTATNGQYELSESIEQELLRGMYNSNFTKYMPSLLPNVINFSLKYCDSKNETLIRAADILANKVFHLMNTGKQEDIEKIDYMFNMAVPIIK